MTPNRAFQTLSFATALFITTLAAHCTFAQSPRASLAQDLGLADPARKINITLQLKLADKNAFDKAVDQLYLPRSPTFHKWMTNDDLRKYAPTNAQRQTVIKELERNGLAVLPSMGPNDFTIRASGPTARVADAFNTQIHEFSLSGQSFRANLYPAQMNGEAANYVASVSGIETHAMHSFYLQALDPRTSRPYPPIPLRVPLRNPQGRAMSTLAPQTSPPDLLAQYSTTTCLTGPVALDLEYGNAPPIADYTGNLYNPPLPCSYTPQQLQAVYRLSKAYNAGLDGTGQTIVIVDAYGSPTILQDANVFSQLAGLPPLTALNFSVLQPEGAPPFDARSATETSLDVEWAHAIAPGAKIVLIEAVSNLDTDLQDCINYAVVHQTGNIISNSYGSGASEYLDYDPQGAAVWDNLFEVAAAKGISANFSTGDQGDNGPFGMSSPLGAIEIPADSPHATAVGGTSILNVPGSTTGQTVTTGWGTTLMLLAQQSSVFDPPQPLYQTGGGFYWGGGGGESIIFPKPAWQSSLPGNGRQAPDISALADPYTGVPIVVTVNGVVELQEGYGGTSLACPIFSALWAIATQYAGVSLGQAAPYVAQLATANTPFIKDVLPTNSVSMSDVQGTIYDGFGATYYSPNKIYQTLLEGNTGFTSAFFPYYAGDMTVISFGLDTTLTVTPGWDNATGWGTPDVGAMGSVTLP